MSTVTSTTVERGTSGWSTHQSARPVVAERMYSASGSQRSSGISSSGSAFSSAMVTVLAAAWLSL
jgi:hypothetical protein